MHVVRRPRPGADRAADQPRRRSTRARRMRPPLRRRPARRAPRRRHRRADPASAGQPIERPPSGSPSPATAVETMVLRAYYVLEGAPGVEGIVPDPPGRAARRPASRAPRWARSSTRTRSSTTTRSSRRPSPSGTRVLGISIKRRGRDGRPVGRVRVRRRQRVAACIASAQVVFTADPVPDRPRGPVPGRGSDRHDVRLRGHPARRPAGRGRTSMSCCRRSSSTGRRSVPRRATRRG